MKKTPSQHKWKHSKIRFLKSPWKMAQAPCGCQHGGRMAAEKVFVCVCFQEP